MTFMQNRFAEYRREPVLSLRVLLDGQSQIMRLAPPRWPTIQISDPP